MAANDYDPDIDADKCIICDDEIPGEHQHILMDIIHSTDEELIKELEEHRPAFLKQYIDLLVESEELLRPQDNGALYCRWCGNSNTKHDEYCWFESNSYKIYNLKYRIKELLKK